MKHISVRWSGLTPSQKIQLSMMLIIGLTCLSWLAILGVDAARSRAEYIRQAMDRTALKAELEVRKFFQPPIRLVDLLKGWIEIGMISDLEKPGVFARTFIPALESTPHLSGVLLCETNGVESFLTRMDEGWRVRSTRPSKEGFLFQYQSFSASGEPEGESVREPADYDPRSRPWFAGALEMAASTNIYWTDVYTFFSTGEPGVTASVLCRPPDSDPKILAVDIPLLRAQELYERIALGEHGHLFLVDTENRVVDLRRSLLGAPGGSDDLDILLQAAVEQSQLQPGERVHVCALAGEAGGWWCAMREIELEGHSVQLGVLEHAEAFSLEVGAERRRIFWMMIAVAGAGILLSGVILRYYLKAVRARARADQVQPIEEQVAAGESERLEFKSSMRWDYQAQSINKKLEEVILKSLAAFNNGKGGTLLIGVNDEGQALGLEPDLQSLRQPDTDHFELHLRNLISQTYGVEYGAAFLRITFPTLQEHTICCIEIEPGRNPLYAPITDKSGRRQEKFFVRSGNASREISRLSEVMQYIQGRFDNGKPNEK